MKARYAVLLHLGLFKTRDTNLSNLKVQILDSREHFNTHRKEHNLKTIKQTSILSLTTAVVHWQLVLEFSRKDSQMVYTLQVSQLKTNLINMNKFC